MIKKLLLFLFCMTSTAARSQQVNWKKIKDFAPDNILLKGERQPTKVLLLGTFHFGYPNMDAHKTDSSKFIDVKSPQRQKEIQELAEVIKRFKPTRIYIEWSNQSWVDSMYGEYRAGRYQLGRNEIYQLGFRIAGQLDLPQLYTVDSWPFSHQYNSRYKWIDSLWNDNNMVDSLRDKYWEKKYSEWYKASDSVEVELTMLENFLLMAEPATLQRMHGPYLANGFNSVSTAGPDILSIWWYNRNLRIFNNILTTRPSSEDRILVLFGNGHVPILKHCFYSSPEFELVELKSLVR